MGSNDVFPNGGSKISVIAQDQSDWAIRRRNVPNQVGLLNAAVRLRPLLRSVNDRFGSG